MNEGEACPEDQCGGKLVVGKAVEVGHIFKLGYKYSESMGARVLDPNGKEVMPIMGSYGIGIERILTAAIEQSNDANGFWLPASIAPFTVVVTVTNVGDSLLRETGEKLARSLMPPDSTCCLMTGMSVPASNSKMRTLWEFPTVSMSARKPRAAMVELVTRATATSVDMPIADILAQVKERVEEACLLTKRRRRVATDRRGHRVWHGGVHGIPSLRTRPGSHPGLRLEELRLEPQLGAIFNGSQGQIESPSAAFSVRRSFSAPSCSSSCCAWSACSRSSAFFTSNTRGLLMPVEAAALCQHCQNLRGAARGSARPEDDRSDHRQ